MRKANFIAQEESILRREVENNFDVLIEKHFNAVINMEKAIIWSEITTKINALSAAPSTLIEVKDTFDIQSQVHLYRIQ